MGIPHLRRRAAGIGECRTGRSCRIAADRHVNPLAWLAPFAALRRWLHPAAGAPPKPPAAASVNWQLKATGSDLRVSCDPAPEEPLHVAVCLTSRLWTGDPGADAAGHRTEIIYARFERGTTAVAMRPRHGGIKHATILTRPAATPFAAPLAIRVKGSLRVPEGETAPTSGPVGLFDAQIAAWDVAYHTYRDEPGDSGGPQSGRNYARANAATGLAGIARRIVLPGVAGGVRALDAGCGTGEWAICLTRLFDRVDAMDRVPDNISFLSGILSRLQPKPTVFPLIGNLEHLPYRAASFDFVFCRGVIYMTRLERSLAELFRVLKPGAEAHLFINADGFNRYLIDIRGIDSPDARRQGRDTLYNTVWRRHRATISAAITKTAPAEDYGTLLKCASPTERDAFLRLEADAAAVCGEEQRSITRHDIVSSVRNRATGHTTTVGSEAWLPHEFGASAAAAGFVDYRWAPHGLEPRPGGILPLDAGPLSEDFADDHNITRHYRGALSVWECRLRKS
jgi:SAM-dependent methyltransferase